MSDNATTDPAALEARVTARYLEKTSVDWQLPDNPFNPAEWYGLRDLPPIPQEQQFPREQWITYPTRRTVVLLIADRALDQWDDLTDEQQSQIAFLLAFGGKERIA